MKIARSIFRYQPFSKSSYRGNNITTVAANNNPKRCCYRYQHQEARTSKTNGITATISRLRNRQESILLCNSKRQNNSSCLMSLSWTRTVSRSRYFSSAPPPPPPPPKNSSSSFVWYTGTFAAAGLAFYLVNFLITKMPSPENDGYEESDGPVSPQAEVTSKVYFDVSIDDTPVGRIIMGLHGSIVPRTVQNFETLCAGTQQIGNLRLSYDNTIFHRIIPDFMIQGGDFTQHNGYGGRCITFDGDEGSSGKFDDENFQLKHLGPGILSMANSGRNTNGSQFFICTQRTKHLDGRHVVFGTVLEGWDTVKKIESVGSSSGRPYQKVRITKAGVLPS